MMFIRESSILHKLNHPALVKFYGINLHSFENQTLLQPTIITEYLEKGSLRSVMNNPLGHKDPNWTPTKKYICLLGISHGMQYVHEKGILHRDLKPENVLLDENYYPRVSDFGLSKRYIDGLTPSMILTMTPEVGTPLYMAPELMSDDDNDQNVSHHYVVAVDIYAFSYIMYEIITGTTPFKKNGKFSNIFSLCNKIKEGVRPEFTPIVTEKMQKLLKRCWATNPRERPPFSEIFNLLSNDFSYISETIDGNEVQNYIDKLKSSFTPATEKPLAKQQISPSNQIPMKNVRLLDLIVDSSKFTLQDNLFTASVYHFYRAVSEDGSICLANMMNIEDLPYHSPEIGYFMNYIDMQALMNHPALLPQIGVSFPSKDCPTYICYSKIDFQSRLSDLVTLVCNKQAPKDYATIKAFAIFGIAAGMAYMHQNHIVHCHLKPTNIYLDKNNHPKIAEFHLACFDGQIDIGKGTPLYMAPEFCLDNVQLTNKIDIYSYSIILYEILTGQLPFKIKNSIQLFDSVSNGERPNLDINISSIQKELLQRCWHQDPNCRPSAIQLVKEFIDRKKDYFDFSVVNEMEFDNYVKEAIQGLDFSLD